MKIQNALEQTFTLIAYQSDAQGAKDVYVMTGQLKEDQGVYFIDRGLSQPNIILEEEWLAELTPREDNLRFILSDSAYQMSIWVDNIEDLYEGNLLSPLFATPAVAA